MTARVVELQAELAAAEAKIDAAYWAFTRQARAKPPVLVVPEAYEARIRIKRQLAELGVHVHFSG